MVESAPDDIEVIIVNGSKTVEKMTRGREKA